jgi:hypothetical protein
MLDRRIGDGDQRLGLETVVSLRNLVLARFRSRICVTPSECAPRLEFPELGRFGPILGFMAFQPHIPKG